MTLTPVGKKKVNQFLSNKFVFLRMTENLVFDKDIMIQLVKSVLKSDGILEGKLLHVLETFC